MMALGVTKANLSKKPPTLLWSRPEDGPVTWHGASNRSINELMNAGIARAPRETAEDFLREFLAHGPRQATEVTEAADEYGISKRTLDRAKAAIGVGSRKEKQSGGQWLWELPTGELAGAPDETEPVQTKDANAKVVDLATLATFKVHEAS
jgi:hypothetical protein